MGQQRRPDDYQAPPAQRRGIPPVRRQVQTNNRDQAFMDTLDALRTRVGRSDERATTGTREMFGDQIGRFEDLTRSQANQTRRALSQLSGLQGGDVAGTFATAGHQVDQQAHEAMGDVMTRFEDRAMTERGRARDRGDQLTRMILSGEGQMVDRKDRREQFAQMRRDQRRQSRRQLLSDILGVGGTIGSAILCWVAGELYGHMSTRTLRIRGFVTEQMSDATPSGMLCRVYGRYGLGWARWVRRWRWMRWIAGNVFAVVSGRAGCSATTER